MPASYVVEFYDRERVLRPLVVILSFMPASCRRVLRPRVVILSFMPASCRRVLRPRFVILSFMPASYVVEFYDCVPGCRVS